MAEQIDVKDFVKFLYSNPEFNVEDNRYPMMGVDAARVEYYANKEQTALVVIDAQGNERQFGSLEEILRLKEEMDNMVVVNGKKYAPEAYIFVPGNSVTDHDPEWKIAAHAAAAEGTLPPRFSRWDLADAHGTTTAHVAARENHLPQEIQNDPNHPVWRLADNWGWSVAHEAAYYNTLPQNMTPDLWQLEDANGKTVAMVAWERGMIPEDAKQFLPEIHEGHMDMEADVEMEMTFHSGR